MKTFLRLMFAQEQVVALFLGFFVGIFVGAMALTVVNLEGSVSVNVAVTVMGFAVSGGGFIAAGLSALYNYAHSDLP